MRESAHAKARRLLVEGRVRVLEAHEDDGVFAAEVRGDHAALYVVSHDADGWSCSCPTRGECSHLLACELIVVFGGTS